MQVMEQSELGHLSVVLAPSDDTSDTTYICDITLTSVSLRKKIVPKPVAVPEKEEGDVATENAADKNVENNGNAAKTVEEPEVEYDEWTCLPKEKCLKVKTIVIFSGP